MPVFAGTGKRQPPHRNTPAGRGGQLDGVRGRYDSAHHSILYIQISFKRETAQMDKINKQIKEGSMSTEEMMALAKMFGEEVKKAFQYQDKLMKLKELPEATGIPYHTLAKMPLPFHGGKGKGGKRYKVSEVTEYLDNSKRKGSRSR